MSGSYEFEEGFGGYVLRDGDGNVLMVMDKQMRDGLLNHPEIKAAYERREAKKAMTRDVPFELAPGIVILESGKDIRGRAVRLAPPHWQALRGRRPGRRK